MFQVYKDKRGEFRWRVVAENGRIVGVSSEGYKNRRDCLAGAEITRDVLLRGI